MAAPEKRKCFILTTFQLVTLYSEKLLPVVNLFIFFTFTDEASSTKLCLPRIAELVQRLCAHDPHQLFLRLEIEVEDFVKEVKERLLKRLSEGYKSPPLARQFMTMLMEEYTSLISASKTLSTVLDKLVSVSMAKLSMCLLEHSKVCLQGHYSTLTLS